MNPVRVIVFVATLLYSSVATLAMTDDRYSPVGVWEVSVSGRALGGSVAGTLYLDVLEDGTLEGHGLLRRSDERWSISGTWQIVGRKVSGVVMASVGSGSFEFTFTASAVAGKSMSMRLQTLTGDRLSGSAKPAAVIADYSGQFKGLFKSHGLTGLITLQVGPQEISSPGLFGITGDLWFPSLGSYALSGYVMCNRRGDFVAFILNEDTGVTASLWGRMNTRSTISGSGIDLGDGARISFKFFETPFYGN